jgi:DNA-directed RNA polymerase I subunit RPA43
MLVTEAITRFSHQTPAKLKAKTTPKPKTSQMIHQMGKKRPDGESKEERRERKRLRKERKQKDGLQNGEEIVVDNGGPVDGPIYQIKMELMISLLPRDLADIQGALHASIRKILLRFSEGIGGVLLSFEKVKILSRGEILNELPHIHYVVSLGGLVFSPKQGQTLTGVIYECFHSHISLVLFGYFNASVPAAELQGSGYQFDARNLTWLKSQQHGSLESVLSKGKTVSFDCHKMYISDGVISIEGKAPRLAQSSPTVRSPPS